MTNKLTLFTYDQVVSIIENILVEFSNRDTDGSDKKSFLNLNLINDLEFDSVDIVSVLMKIEDTFKKFLPNQTLTISTNNIRKIVLVKDLVDAVIEALENIEKNLNPNEILTLKQQLKF